MTHLLFITTFLGLSFLLPASEARWDIMKYGPFKNAYCDYSGYIPGGNKVTIQRITSPTATLQKNIYSGLAGNLGKASNGAMHMTNFVKGFGKLAKLAPKLGPALGLFGVGLSIVKGFTDPTPQDILNAANKAIGQLTTQVNNRLVEMKGYVEEKTINLEKDLVTRKYDTLFRFWGNCLKEVTKEKVNECQEDAAKDIMAARSEFALFSSNVEAKSTNMATYDVKRIEASLLAFREYAILNLASLSTLTATYEDDPAKKAEYLRYANDLNTEIKWIVKYAENAVAIILDMHTRGDNCADTFKFTPVKPIHEGWLNVKTADSITGRCLIDRADVSTRICGYYLAYRTSRKPTPGYSKIITPTASRTDAMKYKVKELVVAKAKRFMGIMKSAIQNYWANEILDLVPSWKGLQIELAKDQILSESEVMERRRPFRFSANYKRRVISVINMREEDSYGTEQFDSHNIARGGFDARNMAHERFDGNNMAHERFDARNMAHERFDAGNMAHERFDADNMAQEKFNAHNMDHEKLDVSKMAHEEFDARNIARKRFDARNMARRRFDARNMAHEEFDARKMAYEEFDARNIARKRFDARNLAHERFDARNIARERFDAPNMYNV